MLSLIADISRLTARAKLGLIAAGVAFFAMLALFPAVAAVIALWGYVSDPMVIEGQAKLLSEVLPPEAYAIVYGQIQTLVVTNNSTLGLTSIISTLFALWSARSGVAALIQGLNAVHDMEDRGGLAHIVAAFVLTMILIGIGIIALAAVIVLPIVLAVIPLGRFAPFTLPLVQWGTAFIVVILGIVLLYRFGPNTVDRQERVWPGMILAVTLWIAASVGFSAYISQFHSYNRIYGSIGAVVALLMWFYLSAYVILLGAALNVALSRRQ